jgi:hypothetical protein
LVRKTEALGVHRRQPNLFFRAMGLPAIREVRRPPAAIGRVAVIDPAVPVCRAVGVRGRSEAGLEGDILVIVAADIEAERLDRLLVHGVRRREQGVAVCGHDHCREARPRCEQVEIADLQPRVTPRQIRVEMMGHLVLDAPSSHTALLWAGGRADGAPAAVLSQEPWQASRR